MSPGLLRAWERRYGLLDPSRTDGGLRLYSTTDERRLREMQAGLSRGLSAAEAARAVRDGAGVDERSTLAPAAAELAAELDAMDAEAAHRTLDDLLWRFTLETVLSGVILPYLHDLGERWERGTASVAQEHLASQLLRARLLALARGWERGDGPLAVLACLPGELHDLPLVAFGLALRERGWRIAFLGADTPIASVGETAEVLGSRLAVLSSVNRAGVEARAKELAALARTHRVALAGTGATAELAARLGCRLLEGDPVAAASAAAL